MRKEPSTQAVKLGPILVAAMKGGAIAAVANMVLYGATRAAGVSYVGEFEGPGKAGALPAFLPAVASFVPSIVAGLLAFVLAKFSSKAAVIFLVISVVFSVVSMMGPVNVGGSDNATKAVLGLMHIVAAVPITMMVLRALKH